MSSQPLFAPYRMGDLDLPDRHYAPGLKGYSDDPALQPVSL